MRWARLLATAFALASCTGTSTSTSTLTSNDGSPATVSSTPTTPPYYKIYATEFEGPALAHFDPSPVRPGDTVQLVLSAPAVVQCGNFLAVFAPGGGSDIKILGLMRLASEPWEWIAPAPNDTPACQVVEPPSTETRAYRTPPLPPGRYLACMQNLAIPEGCAWLQVSGS